MEISTKLPLVGRFDRFDRLRKLKSFKSSSFFQCSKIKENMGRLKDYKAKTLSNFSNPSTRRIPPIIDRFQRIEERLQRFKCFSKIFKSYNSFNYEKMRKHWKFGSFCKITQANISQKFQFSHLWKHFKELKDLTDFKGSQKENLANAPILLLVMIFDRNKRF